MTEVKRYGDKVFIKSGRYPDVPRIYMLEGGRLAGVLDAYGRGPGEYQDAEGFAFCEQTSELIINDRVFKGFRRYSVPEMKWVSDEPLQVVGSGEAQWCSVLLLDLLEDVPSPQGKLYPRLRELKDQGCETVLLFWSAV